LGQIVEAPTGKDGCVRTVRVQYTNPGNSGEKQSPPKTMTRPIHKVAVVVPVEYVFEDDTCDNEVGWRGPKHDLKTREEMEAVKALRKNPTKLKLEEPEAGEVQPPVRKRRGRPKKSERQTTAEDKPRAEAQDGVGAATNPEALQEAGGHPLAVKRGRSRDLGPRGQPGRGRSC
jgi:hypothetical protein